MCILKRSSQIFGYCDLVNIEFPPPTTDYRLRFPLSDRIQYSNSMVGTSNRIPYIPIPVQCALLVEWVCKHLTSQSQGERGTPKCRLRIPLPLTQCANKRTTDTGLMMSVESWDLQWGVFLSYSCNALGLIELHVPYSPSSRRALGGAYNTTRPHTNTLCLSKVLWWDNMTRFGGDFLSSIV